MAEAPQIVDPTKLSAAGRKVVLAEAYSDVWAEIMKLRVDGRVWELSQRAYLRDVYRDNAQRIVCRKSAQMGFTVAFLVKTLHRVLLWKWNGLYLLPTKVGVVPFVQGRFNPIIDENSLIKERFANLDSVTHKRTNQNNLYFRGSTVATDLREIPVDFEIWDERDKMMASNLHLALTRMDGSPHKHLATLSTPTAENWGVDAEYKDSDKREWTLRCPYCNHAQFLDWHENVHIGDVTSIDACKETTEVRCQKCHKPWSHDQIMVMAEDGFWDPQEPGREIHGYYINQLVSPTRTIKELAEIWYKGEIRGDVDASRELWNSALGLPWAAPGDRLTVEVLDNARDQGYRMPTVAGATMSEPLSIGVDVGKNLHVFILAGHGDLQRRVIDVRIEDWNGLRAMFRMLNDRKIYWTAVMDAAPEKAMAEAMAREFVDHLWLAYYHDPKNMSDLAAWSPADPYSGRSHNSVRIDRTMAIDTAHNLIAKGRMTFPMNARHLVNPGREYGDVYAQLMAQTAVTIPDSMGNPRRVYVHPDGKPDHFDHALTYATVASTLQPALRQMPASISLEETPMGQDILGEVSGLFTQDDEGMSFDGFFD